MQERMGSAWLVADFFTYRHRLSGRVDVRYNTVAAQLNDATTSFLVLEDAYVSNVERPGEIVASYTASVFRKACKFMASCAHEEGGFCAGPWDKEVDVEYTYYGLGVLAMALQAAEMGCKFGRRNACCS